MGASDWKDLKAKQKQKLSEVMFGVVCAHYKEHGRMPADAELEKLAKAAFTKIQGRGLGLSYETVHDVFLKKQARFAERQEAMLPGQVATVLSLTGLYHTSNPVIV